KPIPQSTELLLDVPLAELWPVIRATDRINRALRLPSVTYDAPPEGSLVRRARAKLGMIALSWDEPPFEWVEPGYYLVRRRFHQGPFEDFTVGVRLSAEGEKTRAAPFIETLPRRGSPLGLLARPIVSASLRDMSKLLRGIESALKDKKGHPFARSGPAARSLDRRRLDERIGTLSREVAPELRQRMSRHLAEAYDEEVVRMRPFALADDWSMGRMDVLRAFLHAGKSGILDVSWEVLCPNCRVSKAAYSRLSDMKPEAHCETCNISFGTDFSRNVEVQFTVNPAIRKAEDSVYCLGGPGKTPHRNAQLLLEPGRETQVTAALGERRYSLRSLRGRRRLTLLPSPDGARALEAAFKDAEPAQDTASFRPGAVSLRLLNAGAEPLWIALDDEAWSDQGATAALVTGLQDFRDLYSAEVLSADQSVAVRHLAILFSDLKDSTAMYERIGDARAYALVREHFKILNEAIRAQDGSVVKTIGDAVMAVFPDEERGLAACLAIQKSVAAHNERAPEDGRIMVKLGLHSGPSIAVNANASLDYFGTTVNVAARVQAQSEGGDVVLSDAVLASAGVRDLLSKDGGKLEGFTVPLKGLSEHFKLWRLWPACRAP
ncbi:MAG TPA: DUF5939 domain-containing protein, partial [Elusimicrobiota bacterium]|nr:DUF5939 domain-containing protein [Elusimicrobiota bacterium]